MDNSKYELHELEIKNLKKEVFANGRKSLREIQASQGTILKIVLAVNAIIVGFLGTIVGIVANIAK